MEGVGGVIVGGGRDGGCGRGQEWRVWEGSGMECVGGARMGLKGVGGARVGGCWRDRVGGCGRGQGWRVWGGPGLEGVGGDRVGICV